MIKIEGYSGCGIRVFRDRSSSTGDCILEKWTDDPSYVPRLVRQQIKQTEFLSFNKLPFIVSPKVLYVRREDSYAVDDKTGAAGKQSPLRCAIGMNFVHHSDALTFLSRASIVEIDEFTSHILAILRQYRDVSPLSVVPSAVFIDKLLDVKKNILKCKPIAASDVTRVCEVIIPALIESLPAAGLEMPIGKCHGDLTLSNILVAPRPSGESGVKLVLIDFLDAFVESPLADVAKLCQDLKYAWTLRMTNSSADAMSLLLVLRRMFQRLDGSLMGERWYQQYFLLMFIMNQLRVLQYSKDSDVAAYLMSTVEAEFSLWQEHQQKA
jgi:hypothetical protein